jgi:ketosteroid isomerase-like protein
MSQSSKFVLLHEERYGSRHGHRSFEQPDEFWPVTAVQPLGIVVAFDAAWAKHDLDAAVTFLSNDCVFDATGPAPDGTQHVGPVAIRQAWQAIFDDPSSKFETEEIFSSGDRVVARWLYTWSSGHVRGIDVFKVKEGRITEKLSYVKG